jgi:hypothetical protein
VSIVFSLLHIYARKTRIIYALEGEGGLKFRSAKLMLVALRNIVSCICIVMSYVEFLIARLLAGRLHFEQGDAAFGRGFVQCANAADALLHSLHSWWNALLLGAVHVGCHLQQNIFRYTLTLHSI